MKEINLTHHSNRGCQYASSEYVRLLEKQHIKISMTESGDPKDNTQAERINNTMKNELLKGIRFVCIEDVKSAVSCAVDFYNNERLHMSIDMMTPAEAALHEGEIAKLGEAIGQSLSKKSKKYWKLLKMVYLCPRLMG